MGRVDADVVDEHRRRERRRVVGALREGPTHGHVDEQEEVVVEDPGLALEIIGGQGAVELVVQVPADAFGLPGDRVHVEVVREAGGGPVRPGDAGGAGVPRSMDRAVDDGRVLAEVLHDVDLAARGPPDLVDVLAEHPEGGPHSPTPRQADPGLHQTVGEGDPVLGDQSRGGVLATAEPTLSLPRVRTPDHDGEVPASVERGVLGAVGVELQLLVPPAMPADLVPPGGGVHRQTGGPVELLRPGERPSRQLAEHAVVHLRPRPGPGPAPEGGAPFGGRRADRRPPLHAVPESGPVGLLHGAPPRLPGTRLGQGRRWRRPRLVRISPRRSLSERLELPQGGVAAAAGRPAGRRSTAPG